MKIIVELIKIQLCEYSYFKNHNYLYVDPTIYITTIENTSVISEYVLNTYKLQQQLCIQNMRI